MNLLTRWRCISCGSRLDGDEAPESCAECGAAPEDFEEIEDVLER